MSQRRSRRRTGKHPWRRQSFREPGDCWCGQAHDGCRTEDDQEGGGSPAADGNRRMAIEQAEAAGDPEPQCAEHQGSEMHRDEGPDKNQSPGGAEEDPCGDGGLGDAGAGLGHDP